MVKSPTFRAVMLTLLIAGAANVVFGIAILNGWNAADPRVAKIRAIGPQATYPFAVMALVGAVGLSAHFLARRP
jgi:hypothetical protein